MVIVRLKFLPLAEQRQRRRVGAVPDVLPGVGQQRARRAEAGAGGDDLAGGLPQFCRTGPGAGLSRGVGGAVQRPHPQFVQRAAR
ncbi:MAG TPA: hypothetical protein VNL77_05105, partial [Roseiflexaceae bacterium]|nr:hypothetical protein [Roseiflexaceae bacterium]